MLPFVITLVLDIIEVNSPYLSFINITLHPLFLQEIISEEIIDETDQYEDNHSKRRVRRQTTTGVLGGCVINTLFKGF